MRRNRNTSRGGGGNVNRSGSVVRPFIADHLKDIDLELDLLKRKRQMLEQQQQQFIEPLIQQRSFTQQPYYQLEPKQSGSNRDFSHLYNDGSQQYRKPYGRKRQSDSDWQHNSNPKRSAGQGQRGSSYAGPSTARNQRSYGGQNQQTKSTSFKYGQGKQFIGQKINNQKQQKPSKNYVANKVTKAKKAFVPPNTLASQPVADRNKLVAAAIKSVAEVETMDREALRLLPDAIPTKQMTGRLELALGAILRDIRDKYAESSHLEILRTSALQRVIKQAIRERIRSAMLGKIVGATQEIVKEYRAMYPKDTDMEIVNIALEAAGIKPENDPKPIVLEKDRPDEYFKVAMIKLIDTHLKEMFDKIEEIYKAENKDEPSQEIIREDNNMEANNEPVGDKVEETVVAANEDNITASNNEVDTTANVEIVEAEKGNSIEPGNDDNTEVEKQEKVEAANGEHIEATNGDNAATASIVENVAAGNTENVVNTENVEIRPQNVEVRNQNVEQLLSHANDYKRMLPRLLKRHIPTILKLLHLNKMYKRAVADISNTTRAKFVEYGKPNDSSTAETSEVSQTPKKFPAPYVVLPYYVKVMGKPQLPKKKIMNTFLETFNPKSIKKHRSIHNLLFIGFTEKSDFDAIVQADGTIIGRNILSIRVCDKNAGKTNANAQNNTSSNETDQNVSQSQDTNDINQDIKMESVKEGDNPGNELDEQIKESATDGDNLGNELDGQIKDSPENKVEDCIKIENQENEALVEANGEPANEDKVVGDGDEVLTNVDVKDTEKTEDTGDTEIIENKDEGKAEPEEVQQAGDEKNDEVAELKNTAGRATPTRASTRLSNAPATPSSIRTRRASRLMQN